MKVIYNTSCVGSALFFDFSWNSAMVPFRRWKEHSYVHDQFNIVSLLGGGTLLCACTSLT